MTTPGVQRMLKLPLGEYTCVCLRVPTSEVWKFTDLYETSYVSHASGGRLRRWMLYFATIRTNMGPECVGGGGRRKSYGSDTATATYFDTK